MPVRFLNRHGDDQRPPFRGGENDPGWREAMKDQSDMLRQKGFKISFAVEPGMEHSLESLAGAGSKRLFDHMEESARTCK